MEFIQDHCIHLFRVEPHQSISQSNLQEVFAYSCQIKISLIDYILFTSLASFILLPDCSLQLYKSEVIKLSYPLLFYGIFFFPLHPPPFTTFLLPLLCFQFSFSPHILSSFLLSSFLSFPLILFNTPTPHTLLLVLGLSLRAAAGEQNKEA